MVGPIARYSAKCSVRFCMVSLTVERRGADYLLLPTAILNWMFAGNSWSRSLTIFTWKIRRRVLFRWFGFSTFKVIPWVNLQHTPRMYHFQGESLPDRFHFHDGPGAAMTGRAAQSDSSSDDDVALRTVKAKEKEDDERNIAQLASQAVVADTPMRHAFVGPGTNIPAVRRYLGVMKPVLMFRLLQRWVADHSLGTSPGFTTFRRALVESRRYLSFRKSSGQHSTCDTCKYHKDKLKSRNLSISERCSVMESYSTHLLNVWRDRQSDASFVALSVQTALHGAPFEFNGLIMLRSDGLDQAKHRTPRILCPTKLIERLPRPVLPVMMHWGHGHVFQFAIQEMDVRKSTATNLEGICRLLSAVYDRYEDMPATVHLLLDNTPSQNKNSIMIRFWVKVLLLGVCRSVHIRFPLKGHTHNAIDALGGAAVTACSNQEFQTAEELTQVYRHFLRRVRFESSVWLRDAYQCDEQARPRDSLLMIGDPKSHTCDGCCCLFV